MGIDVERTLMLGKLAGLKETLAKDKIKAENLCKSICTGLNLNLNKVEEMDIAQASTLMDELVIINIDILDSVTQIQRLEKALNG